MIATRDGALTAIANAGFAFEIGGAYERVANASVFGEIRDEFEFTGARANRFAIFDRALHIRTAQFVAFVDAVAANAASAARAFVVADTLADRMASSRFGETGVAGWTFARVTGAGRTEFAHGRFGAMCTCVSQLASGVRNWIAAIAGRALADGRLIFGDANGIFAARQFVAHVVAGVCESIAQLRWRTIDVVDTRHAFAAGRHVIWIAVIRTRRTLAFCDVIVANAHRL